MRQLYIIPIVHSRHDLGTLEQPIRDIKKQFLNGNALDQNQKVLDAFWEELKLGIESWKIDYSNTFVFQDALPFTGQPERIIEHRIVDELASKGSANHKLVKWLIERGAQLVGTESTELLIKEYEAVKKSLSEGVFQETDNPGEPNQDAAASLLTQRDHFIAQRIIDTLHPGNVGILFIGLQHRVQDYLPDDLVVEYPFGRAKDHECPRIFEPST
ncbi:MAG: hypothetical protein MUC83_09785 [Pirellula sp.]|jgi:hypothetical protein|nr:hypothetical protein [Pirellula sp.]